jgi:hypothetical protein
LRVAERDSDRGVIDLGMDTPRPNHDPFLAFIVRVHDTSESRDPLGFGVTLTVSGILISGFIIPKWQWFEDVTNQMSNAARAEGADPGLSWAVLFARATSDATEQRDAHLVAMEQDSDAGESGLLPTVHCIHLQKARIFGASSEVPILPTSGGMYWRGRLSEVSGWAAGTLGDLSD